MATAREMGLRQARDRLADLVNDAAVRGTVTYLTNRGRRIAALTSMAVAEAETVDVQRLIGAVRDTLAAIDGTPLELNSDIAIAGAALRQALADALAKEHQP